MRMFDIISRKRDGLPLGYEELEYFINGIVDKSIPDYQTTALLMAIYLNGMSNRETSDMCLLMARSGDMMEFSDELVTVDKHSTGGVGDKTSLIVAPMAAAFGLTVAKMSGRALGHTGGTVDKLESIPGMKVDMTLEEFEKAYRKTGICISGQSGNMVPADKILYSLRDVTATISCIPLIATSIMSKKLAAGAKNIVLDVKTGSGAFMENPEEAFALAEKMVRIGLDNGRNVSALVTMMDTPLGYCIGNSLEVMEAIDVLKGGCAGFDLCEVSIALTAELISMASGMDVRAAAREAEKRIKDGSALKKLREMIISQGGNPAVIEDYGLFKQPRTVIEARSPESGYVSSIDAKSIGDVSMNLGAGRSRKTDPIDYSAGIRLAKKPGDRVEKGEVLAYLYTDREDAAGQAGAFLDACEFSRTMTKEKKLILGRVSKDGREVY
ncbi:MAG: thymidine phosphorylase [Clostridia bacterium]|nr:thymidine phosphorylase [Clostridia bacterium]